MSKHKTMPSKPMTRTDWILGLDGELHCPCCFAGSQRSATTTMNARITKVTVSDGVNAPELDNPSNWCEPCGSFHPATTPCTEPRAEPDPCSIEGMIASERKRTATGQVPAESRTLNGSNPKSEPAPAAAPEQVARREGHSALRIRKNADPNKDGIIERFDPDPRQPAPTPRTDAEVALMCHVAGVDPDFARQLERELAAAIKMLATLEKQGILVDQDLLGTLTVVDRKSLEELRAELAAAKDEIQEVKDDYEELITVQTRRKMQAEIADLQARLDAVAQEAHDHFQPQIDDGIRMINELQARLDAPTSLPLTEEELELIAPECNLETFEEMRTQALAAIAFARQLNAPCPEVDGAIERTCLLPAKDALIEMTKTARTLARRLAESKAASTLKDDVIALNFNRANEAERRLAEAEKDAERYRLGKELMNARFLLRIEHD